MIIINNWTGIGRLVRDPELRYLTTGTATCNFTLAVDRGLSKEKKQEMEAKNQPTADFIRIVVWGKAAENAANYLVKGRLVAIQGRIQTGSYEKDGQRVYTTDINAQQVEFLEWNNKQDDTNSNSGMGNIDGFIPTDNEEVPF